jgi:hypothetical protein
MRNSLLAIAAIAALLLGCTIGAQAGPATSNGGGEGLGAPASLPDFGASIPMGEAAGQQGPGPSFGGQNAQGDGFAPSAPGSLSGPADEDILPSDGAGKN